MSKVIPDPQIQSLKAMRAGDIAFAVGSPAVQTIGKLSVAIAQPIILKSINPFANVSLETPVLPAGESPVIGAVFAETLSQDSLISVPLTTTNALEALTAMPSESPTVGVAFSTSVV